MNRRAEILKQIHRTCVSENIFWYKIGEGCCWGLVVLSIISKLITWKGSVLCLVDSMGRWPYHCKAALVLITSLPIWLFFFAQSLFPLSPSSHLGNSLSPSRHSLVKLWTSRFQSLGSFICADFGLCHVGFPLYYLLKLPFMLSPLLASFHVGPPSSWEGDKSIRIRLRPLRRWQILLFWAQSRS